MTPVEQDERALTLAEIDQKLSYLAECVTTYVVGGEPPLSPVTAWELIDELLDLRLKLTAAPA